MANVYEIVTERITEQMAKGVVPWRKPWDAKEIHPANYSGRRYNGINFFTMSLMSFATPVFLTFGQIKKLGGTFKAGREKTHYPVFFWAWPKVEKTNAVTGADESFTMPIFKYFRVWNIDDVEGIELPSWYVKSKAEKAVRKFNPIESCEAVIKGYEDKPVITNGHAHACYIPSTDVINMPLANVFDGDTEYYATLFHECIHSTGSAKRLARKEVTDPIKFGSHDYSVEELCAELGAAFLCAETGISNEKLTTNTVAYLQSWIAKLKEQPKMFAMAAARAQKAADHILGRNAAINTEE